MLFQQGKLSVREVETKDEMLLVKWLSDPRVLAYYDGRDNPFDLAKVRGKFYNREDESVRCIVEYEEEAIGYIQFYPLEEEEREVYGYVGCPDIIYGMDQFIGEVDYWNKGVGTRLVSAMVQYLVTEKKADKIVMDPQTWNERALRCYEKVGFQKVKLLPKRELHEGEYRDCWLIEYTKRMIE
ncbi:GNAT family N-acetyltransferase [Priestia taiwanensis]|uniref:N-acetyltransferase n=1 Tax=Priestia taiwanensis TaxID=1347902 RepID=A0A917AVG0_9BACI|nr:GNAT family N-acetyltransferase [Priestia taiwanensis]MBM7364647.1 aminoglycoside 6'-N-acetyltransferase [Priestia taiwanensis]GGE78512.1 N-acetyltransferase [Priestia taiwanensis]